MNSPADWCWLYFLWLWVICFKAGDENRVATLQKVICALQKTNFTRDVDRFGCLLYVYWMVASLQMMVHKGNYPKKSKNGHTGHSEKHPPFPFPNHLSLRQSRNRSSSFNSPSSQPSSAWAKLRAFQARDFRDKLSYWRRALYLYIYISISISINRNR